MYFVNNTLYVNNDGGISISKNSGTTFSSTANKGIATLQFVNVDADKAFTFVLGGTQDNGTNRSYTSATSFNESRGGDGGYVVISPDDPSICYSEYVEGEMFKSIDSGKTWTAMTPPFQGSAPFYMPFDFDASGTFGLAAAGNLYYTQTGGSGAGAWAKCSPVINSPTAVHVYPSDPTYMWVGDGASFYRSTDAGQTFVKGTNPTGAVNITGIVADPKNPLNIWICSQGTGASNKHVYKSTDGGMTFTGLPNFPNIGCWWIARQHRTGDLYVATDKGVYITKDEGQTWFKLDLGMPNVQVLTLRVRGLNEEWLLAGTYGRGMFKLDISDLTSVNEPVTAPVTITLDGVSPNPIRNGIGSFTFTISKNAIVTATMYDVLGRAVKTLAKSPYSDGKHTISFTTQDVPTGSYIISVVADGVAKTQRVIVE
jgi:photosystem II stability/assembly factor-like uncharacterized protein